MVVRNATPAGAEGSAAPEFFRLSARYTIAPGASVGDLVEDARCLVGAGLDSVEGFIREHVNTKHEGLWAGIYTLEQGKGVLVALAERCELESRLAVKAKAHRPASCAQAEGVLFEHDDGRYRVSSSADDADFARNDPAWHRVGPVDVSALREVSHV